MRSKYKPIGQFIQKVDSRNKDLQVTNLRGISMTKEFRTSTSNVVGTDMSKYKIVSKWQFACDFMSVIRVNAFPVVLQTKDNPVIVSPAYPVFEVIDKNILLPEYLMMWMRRSEFDRYAFFKCDSAIRGGFGWEELCETELPVPQIDKQREIIREYNTIVDRIQLNEQLNQKLEKAAQALYNQWFVDFEFPISKEYAESIGKLELEGKPYKSSGGEMIYDAEYDNEVPKDWFTGTYEDHLSFKTGKLNSNAAIIDGRYPFFTCSAETYLTNTFAFDCEAVLLAGNNASAVYPLKYFVGKFDAYQRTYVISPNHEHISVKQIYFSVKSELEGFKGTSSGTTTKFLTMKLLNALPIVIAGKSDSSRFMKLMDPLFSYKLCIEKEIIGLTKVKNIFLNGMSVKAA